MTLISKLRFLGSGPDRGRSPEEWGEIPYVYPYVRPSIPPPALLVGPHTPLVGLQTQKADGRTCGVSPHSAGLRPLSGPLPCYPLRLHNIKEAGQGNR